MVFQYAGKFYKQKIIFLRKTVNLFQGKANKNGNSQ